MRFNTLHHIHEMLQNWWRKSFLNTQNPGGFGVCPRGPLPGFCSGTAGDLKRCPDPSPTFLDNTLFVTPSFQIILRAWLYGMLLVTWGGWQLLGKRYWLVSVGLEYKSVDSTSSDKELEVSRKEMVVLDISWVNLIEGCRLLARERKSTSYPHHL